MLPFLLSLSSSSSSSDPPPSTVCNNLTYSFHSGHLNITGSGEIISSCTTPFKSSTPITLHIGEGISTIGRSSFSEFPSISVPIFPSTLLKIDRSAFASSSISGNISFPPTLQLISSESFGNATFDSAVIFLPPSVTIYADSFIFASGILRYEVDPAHPKYANDSCGCLYNKTFGIIYQFPPASPLTHFTLTPSVSFLAHDGVFAHARNLVSIDLRESQITTLQELTFYGCWNLTEVLLPKVLRAIRPFGFLFCGIRALEIPRNVSWIEAGTFAGSQNLGKISVDPENLYFTMVGEILYDVNLTTVYCVPPGIEKWGVIAFPESVREIGEAALQAVKAEGIVFPDSLKVIGELALGRFDPERMVAKEGGVVKVDWISIGGGIEDVGENAFFEAELGRIHWRGKTPPGKELCDEVKKAVVGKVTVDVNARVSDVCGMKAEKWMDPNVEISEKENL